MWAFARVFLLSKTTKALRGFSREGSAKQTRKNPPEIIFLGGLR
jgi:hypothetical protein